MSDLEKFLQQAAMRAKERQQGGGQQSQRPPQQAQQPPRNQPAGNQPPRNQPPRNQPPRAQPSQPNRHQTLRQPSRDQSPVMEAEIIDALVVDDTSHGQGHNRLSNIGTRSRLGTDNVNSADERMASHVQQVFEHGVGQLSPKPAIQISDPSAAQSDQTNRKTEVQTQDLKIHWLAQMMRQPDTVRALFIASEVFKRKF